MTITIAFKCFLSLCFINIVHLTVLDSADEPNSEDENDEEEKNNESENENDDSSTSDVKEGSENENTDIKVNDFLSSTQAMQHDSQEATVNSDVNAMQYKKRILVCGICLESDENENDEILECDNCGITVHEGCYGVIDQDVDDDESDSDAPTEPWFCELCKAGLKESPYCELCPNRGGIYKQTDTGKWVHLICALYTPYVGFRDISRLQTIILEDIKPYMWGSKDCLLCVDENFSRTGVCIGCDAGLCKTTFHVTCAQRNGFLSDIPDKENANDDEVPELLYAHCKLHSVKIDMRKRKSSWLAFQSHMSKFKPTEDEQDKERIASALIRAKKSFAEFRLNVVISKPPPQEYPRLLSSCPEACVLLARKAEVLGLVQDPQYNLAAAVVSGKIVKGEANFSAEYVMHFFKREMEIRSLEYSIKNSGPTLLKLKNEEKMLTSETQKMQLDLDNAKTLRSSLIQSHQTLYENLCKLSSKTLKLPKVLQVKKKRDTDQKINEVAELLTAIVNKCAACASVDDQHLLTQCSICKNFYHLGCVDPPLTRMPKTSGKWQWRCTECDSSDESEAELVNDSSNLAGRKKRVSKEPEKFNANPSKEKNEKSEETRKRKSSIKESKITPKKMKKLIKSENTKENSTKTRVRKPRKSIDSKRKDELLPNCCICNDEGDKNSLVQCDQCKKCYHFKTCLNPPCSKTPKAKYYGWICEDCDESEDDEAEGRKETEEKDMD